MRVNIASSIVKIESVLWCICYVDAVVPLECPTNLNVNESSLSSTGVELMWNAVGEGSDTVQGFFTGYRVTVYTECSLCVCFH